MKKYTLLLLATFFFIAIFSSCKKENGDTNKPFIVILGFNPTSVALDSQYSDVGAEAWDVTETGDTIDISTRLSVNNGVNTSIEGNYEVKYNVSDEAGNQANEQIRNVKVLLGK